MYNPQGVRGSASPGASRGDVRRRFAAAEFNVKLNFVGGLHAELRWLLYAVVAEFQSGFPDRAVDGAFGANLQCNRERPRHPTYAECARYLAGEFAAPSGLRGAGSLGTLKMEIGRLPVGGGEDVAPHVFVANRHARKNGFHRHVRLPLFPVQAVLSALYHYPRFQRLSSS